MEDAVAHEHRDGQQRARPHRIAFHEEGDLHGAKDHPGGEVDQQRGVGPGEGLAPGDLLTLVVFAPADAALLLRHLCYDRAYDRHEQNARHKTQCHFRIHRVLPPHKVAPGKGAVFC